MKSLALPETGFLRLSEVLKIFPVSRSTWYNGVQGGRYPKPTKLGARAAGYSVKDILKLLERIEAGQPMATIKKPKAKSLPEMRRTKWPIA